MKENLLMAGSVLAVLFIGAPDRPVSAKLRGTLSGQAQKPPSQDRKERLMKALKELNNPDPDTRQSAVEHLGQMGDMSVVEPLASALADAHPEVRAQAEKSMWLIWLRSGKPETDKILYLGMELMAAGQLQNAINAFTRVIERAPNFAEGYNKRATAFYLAGQFEKSIVDCDAKNLPVAATHVCNASVEPELGAMCFGSHHDIVSCQFRIIHVARFGSKNRSFNLFRSIGIPETMIIFRTSRWTIRC